ncbi:SDR family NAD(P)-dependent oxidoreductase [Duganella vulcania]|uniref:SDR family NAD(P)-dependent oxidoreductase n=1 Tax=Duganella vulcania TaxID=2692166 RepID=A0A845GJ87_9BURK|nr:SDR family NAD(P)-dependent oxidoreductase [Duganella vulcania]MYM92797.1 SDR family NAD(P)-dependent oxidoreductase [Duganella vulcania]
MTILITGCSSGIGLAACQFLRRRGFTVIASARRASDVALLEEQGFPAVLLDSSDENSVSAGFEQAVGLAGGRIHAVFCNAGEAFPGALEDLSRRTMQLQFASNFFGTHQLVALAIKHMRDHGATGRIVLNSSVLGFVAMPYRGAYAASKFAMEALGDTLRLELATTNIRVSLLQPGPILTRFRATSLVNFAREVDQRSSAHRRNYQALISRLEKPGAAVRFTLMPQDCMAPLEHALTARRPKARYRVTVLTKVLAMLKRLLPAQTLDRMLQNKI